MKAIWTGSIGFGLVNIPIKMYAATEDSTLDLDMLDKDDNSKIQFKRVNSSTGKEVEWANIIKAYDYNGKYVLLTDEDFEKASPEKSKIISIERFVKEEEIDSVYFESPYFLEPQKNADHAYNLLFQAMKKTGMAGMGTFIMRNKEALGILRVFNEVIIFQKIRFAEEVRDSGEVNVPKAKVKPAEVDMAVTLIKQLSGKFNINEYKDEYTAALKKLIEQKAKGKKTTEPKMKVVHSKATDLMEQLKASLAASKDKKAS